MKLTKADLVSFLSRYRGLSLIEIQGGMVFIHDGNIGSDSIYGKRGGDVGDAIRQAMDDVIAEYGVK